MINKHRNTDVELIICNTITKMKRKKKLYISQSNNTNYILQFNCEVIQKRRKKKHFRTYTHNILKEKKITKK